jgi:hypothetical protein
MEKGFNAPIQISNAAIQGRISQEAKQERRISTNSLMLQ